MNFEQIVANRMNEIRQRFANANIGSIRVDIEVSGRTEAGDCKIAYKVGDVYGESGQATAFNLDAAIDEYMRRRGWNESNKPMALSHLVDPPKPAYLHVTGSVDDDEIPF